MREQKPFWLAEVFSQVFNSTELINVEVREISASLQPT